MTIITKTSHHSEAKRIKKRKRRNRLMMKISESLPKT
jgi:hypothetical protein